MKRALLVLVLITGTAPAAPAHEIGKTQVVVVIRDGAYSIDVTVDPDALLVKLEVFSGAPLSAADVGRADRDRRINAPSVTPRSRRPSCG